MVLQFKKQTTCVHPEARNYKGLDHAAKVALQFNVDYATCLGMVREARNRGLTAPVILMGKFTCSALYS
jgi:tryptophan synthase alpha subunit